MNLHASSSIAWMVLGVVAIAAAAVIWPVFESGSAAPATRPAEGSAQRDAEYWRMVICYGAYGFGYIIPATFLPVMAKAIVSDPMLFGWAWPVFGLAAVTSTLIAQRARGSLRRVWAASHFVMAIGVVMPLVVPGLAGIIVAALCVGGTFVVITQVGLQEARAVAGEHARSLIAAMTSAFALGQIVGPLLAGYWVKATGGFSGALVLASTLLVISAAALLRPTGRLVGSR
jgi:predicted MFS family arabinose efflux permease